LEDRTGVELNAMYKFRGELATDAASAAAGARSTSKNAYLPWCTHRGHQAMHAVANRCILGFDLGRR